MRRLPFRHRPCVPNLQTPAPGPSSPEDTILAKLEGYRLGGEIPDRQWNDILGVLTVQGEFLDFSCLHHWAPELEVTDLLARARDDAGV